MRNLMETVGTVVYFMMYMASMVYLTWVFSTLVEVSADALYVEPDIYDQWTVADTIGSSKRVEDELRANDWISNSVTSEEFDRIFTLVSQLQPVIAPDVPVEMILAVISAESSYIQDLVGFNDDSGLMQVIPKFHRERIAQYLYSDDVDIFDAIVNISTGMDYLSELTEFSSADDALTLMAYNEGPAKARQRRNRGITSAYAEVVLERMATIKKAMDGRYGKWEGGESPLLTNPRPESPKKEWPESDHQQKPLKGESSNW